MPRIPWPWRSRRRAPTDRAELGRWGEDVAARELKRRKYRILGRNVRVGRGELDIVAADRDETVFVEVKTRRDQAFGGARAALTHAKSHRLERLAQTYLRQHPDRAGPYRIDVVAIDVDPTGDYTVDVIPNAVQL
ncbi:MAG: YraN family protein [Chloroflexi bacterium]|nr:YraN family protein [Chloroflexota bacterium]